MAESRAEKDLLFADLVDEIRAMGPLGPISPVSPVEERSALTEVFGGVGDGQVSGDDTATVVCGGGRNDESVESDEPPKRKLSTTTASSSSEPVRRKMSVKTTTSTEPTKKKKLPTPVSSSDEDTPPSEWSPTGSPPSVYRAGRGGTADRSVYVTARTDMTDCAGEPAMTVARSSLPRRMWKGTRRQLFQTPVAAPMIELGGGASGPTVATVENGQRPINVNCCTSRRKWRRPGCCGWLQIVLWLIAAVGIGYAIWKAETKRHTREWVTEGMPSSTTEWHFEDLHEIGAGNGSAGVDDLLKNLGG